LQDILDRIRATRECGILTDWELGFTESLIGQLEKGKGLSVKQVEVFDRIERNASPQAQAEATSWKDGYDKEKRSCARVAANYYLNNGPYFRNLCERILSEEDFVLTEKQYRKMVENKYMAKVFAAITDDPKFPVGSIVQVRTNCSDPYVRHALANNKPAVVISDNEPVISAARGAKRYKLLPVGASSMVVAEERWIKKAKKMASR
jgi:hypothetical protein